MWSEWNSQWVYTDTPRLMVRFEDILFHAERVMELITNCIGQPLAHPYRYHLEASKGHGNSSDFATALAKYGRGEGRLQGFEENGKEYLRTALHPRLMHYFRYRGVDACAGKERFVEILQKAGMADVRDEHCEELPLWEETASLYGHEPVVYGLESCEKFRESLSAKNNDGTAIEPILRVAGLFNTGTNAMAVSLMLNYKNEESVEKYNAHGGKHTPVNLKTKFKRLRRQGIKVNELDIVMIRDPLRWFQSMVGGLNCVER
jgi:hypothetical protein